MEANFRQVNMKTWLAAFAVDAPEITVKNITADSREVTQGDCFIALKGELADGADYNAQAEKQGAVALIISAKCNLTRTPTVPYVVVSDLEHFIGEFASAFYGYPSANLDLVGVTGTNGKTTTAYYIAYLAQQLNQVSGIIGTLGQGILGELTPSINTTPGAIQLQQQLDNMVQQNCETVAMEVSSHGLFQNRVLGCRFDSVVFTNLSRDHLDYHSTMHEYELAKKRLFTDYNANAKIVNVDDPVGQSWCKEFSAQGNVWAYGCLQSDIHADKYIYYTDVNFTQTGTHTKIKSSWGEFELSCPVIGLYNLSNVLAAISSLVSVGFNIQDVIYACQSLPAVPGRMETFKGEEGPTVIVDYAHTPDALESALNALKEHQYGKVWCVFGCGGDRDNGKRALMGSVAQLNSDFSIVTNDNPRTESPEKIAQDILSGMNNDSPVFKELDRKQAILQAYTNATDDDVILVAGKGHEDYQIIGEQTLPFNDRAIVASLVTGAA